MLRPAYAIEKRVMGNTASAILIPERLILLYFSTKSSFCLVFRDFLHLLFIRLQLPISNGLLLRIPILPWRTAIEALKHFGKIAWTVKAACGRNPGYAVRRIPKQHFSAPHDPVFN